MKIINQKLKKNLKPVSKTAPGTVVQFNRQFHQDYPPNDLYIVLDVCSSYDHRTAGGFRDQKTGVANLATGKLSFVSDNREVTIMTAEVSVNGPEN